MSRDTSEPVKENRESDAGLRVQAFSVSSNCSKDSYFPIHPHWHQYCEILYIICGRAKCYVGNDFIEVGKGDLVFVNPNMVHAIYNEEEYLEYTVVKFDVDILFDTAKTVSEANYLLPFSIFGGGLQRVFSNETLRDTVIPTLLNELLDESINKKYGYALSIRMNICKIFLWMLRELIYNNKNENKFLIKQKDLSFLKKVTDYVDEHYYEEISVKEMAKQSNLSYSHFSRNFKRAMGKTLIEYINYIRVSEAEKLLLTENMDVTQVALNVGFCNTSYFIKQFKNYKNITPNHYRKMFSETSTILII